MNMSAPTLDLGNATSSMVDLDQTCKDFQDLGIKSEEKLQFNDSAGRYEALGFGCVYDKYDIQMLIETIMFFLVFSGQILKRKYWENYLLLELKQELFLYAQEENQGQENMV